MLFKSVVSWRFCEKGYVLCSTKQMKVYICIIFSEMNHFQKFCFLAFYEKRLCKDLALQMEKITFGFFCMYIRTKVNHLLFSLLPSEIFWKKIFFLHLTLKILIIVKIIDPVWVEYSIFHFFKFCICLVWSKCNCYFIENWKEIISTMIMYLLTWLTKVDISGVTTGM